MRVLCAIAVCRKFKNSEEIRKLEASSLVDWGRECKGEPCSSSILFYKRIVRCGWCLFTGWLYQQKLPKELKSFVLEVFKYLSANSQDFNYVQGVLLNDMNEGLERQV